MIVPEFEPYCEDCTDFRSETTTENGVTVIRCSDRLRCDRIAKLVRKEMEEEKSSNGG